MKTKENGENIYKMLNAWLKGNNGYKERDRKENACRTVDQFLIVFL